MSDPRVQLRAVVGSIAALVRGLPRIAWIILALGQLLFVGSGLLPYPLTLVAGLIVGAALDGYLVLALLGGRNHDLRLTANLLRRRFKDVLGLDVLRYATVVGLAFVPFVLVEVARTSSNPPNSAPTVPSSSTSIWTALLVSLLATPVYARWSASLPLIVGRLDGTRTAMRRSWAATRGSTIKIAVLAYVSFVPALISVILPAAVRLPVSFVDGAAETLFGAAVAVAVFRQLFPALQRTYALTEEGRVAFETDAAIFGRQGYFVRSSGDDEGGRSITFGPLDQPATAGFGARQSEPGATDSVANSAVGQPAAVMPGWPQPARSTLPPGSAAAILAAAYRPIRRRARIVTGAVALAGVLVFFVVPDGEGYVPGLLVGITGSYVARSAYLWWASRTHIQPAMDVLWFARDRLAQLCQQLDGKASIPMTREAAFKRLGTRSDDLAMSLSLTTLWQYGDLEGLRAGLANWHPDEGSPRATWARLESRLALLDGVDDLGGARAAVAAIDDPEVRLTEEAAFASEESRRAALLGRDGLEPLIRLQPAIKGKSLPIFGPRLRRDRRLEVVRFVLGAAILPAILGTAGAAGWLPDPVLFNITISGSGLVDASDGIKAQAVHLIENAASSSTFVRGPLSDADTSQLEDVGGAREIVCPTSGLKAPASLPISSISCVYVLMDGGDEALVSPTPLPNVLSNPFDFIDGPPVTAPTYLVKLPTGTITALAALIHVDPYANDGWGAAFATGFNSISGPTGQEIGPPIDAALPAAVLISGPMTTSAAQSIVNADAPAMSWVPGGRPTNMPASAPGQRIYSVWILTGSADGEAIVTYESKDGPAYLYRIDPALGTLIKSLFTDGRPSP